MARMRPSTAFQRALELAKLAEINEIGAVSLSPDGTIRIERLQPQAPTTAAVESAEDEIAKWRASRGKA